jgi:hypothetical protein
VTEDSQLFREDVRRLIYAFKVFCALWEHDQLLLANYF